MATLTASTPRFPSGFSLPESAPEAWQPDVAQVEAALQALSPRHDDAELAQILLFAAQNYFTTTKRARSGLAGALVRGVAAREQLKEAEGGSVSADEARAYLGGISKQAVLDRFKKHRLLGWRETRQNAVRFPIWQFSTEGTLPGLEAVLGTLRASSALDDWGAILFFLNKRASLGDKRPLDALREGKLEEVQRDAHGFAAN
ncbi:MAG: hypothetical protein NTU80_04455 [Verrucomicrobia bacterium]|nr:hypothetical protein [Verrucomicrobiota bacterium]